jgi:diguanylate cyclase (GGDEF)-like protein
MREPDPAGETLRQLAALNRIARIALEDLELRPMLQRIVDTLHAEFGWEFIACARVDAQLGEFCCEALFSDLTTDIVVGYQRPLGSGVVGECALTGQTLDIEDTRDHPNFVETLYGTRSELCVPVKHGEEVLAVLNVESRRPAAFRGQRALLETVADQIAGAIRAANLLGALQRANDELRQAYAIVEAVSEHDSLTRIGNRRAFDAWFGKAFNDARNGNAPLSLVLADVDAFKAYNDDYGHLAGDECLRLIAAILQETIVGTPAWLARYGGEEFAIILPATTPAQAMVVAERLREAVQHCELEHRNSPIGKVTVSIGAATCLPHDLMTPDALFDAADRALYDAKRSGRNRAVAAA